MAAAPILAAAAQQRFGSARNSSMTLLDSRVGGKRQILIPNRDFRAYLSRVVAQDVRDIARDMHEVVGMRADQGSPRPREPRRSRLDRGC